MLYSTTADKCAHARHACLILHAREGRMKITAQVHRPVYRSISSTTHEVKIVLVMQTLSIFFCPREMRISVRLMSKEWTLFCTRGVIVFPLVPGRSGGVVSLSRQVDTT